MVATGKRGKPLLGVIGFLGRGNVGDEAIFQCIYEAFQDQFDIVVASTRRGPNRAGGTGTPIPRWSAFTRATSTTSINIAPAS